MDIDTLHTTISATTREDWNRITGWGANTGPVHTAMLKVFNEDHVGTAERFHIRSHSELFVLRSDLDISIAWGMDVDPASDATGRQPLRPEWASARGWEPYYQFADLRWRGELVDRHMVVTVNGDSWAILPAGFVEHMPGDYELPPIVRVSRFQYDLARLLHMIVYGDSRTFKAQFEATEIVIDG